MALWWLLGVTLSILGSVISATGYALQRWSHKNNESLPADERKPPHLQWANILGIACMGVEAVCEALALNFAEESLIASLASIAIVINLVVAPRFLGEERKAGDWTITALVTGGTTLIVLFESHSEAVLTWDVLFGLFLNGQFATYFICMLLVLVSLLALANRHHLKLRSTALGRIGALNFLWTMDFVVKAHRFALPTIAAICAGFMAMFGKAVMALLTDTVQGDNQFRFFGPWLIMALCVGFLLAQIRFLNEALGLYNALMIVPFYETMNSLFGILNGAMYYRDMDSFSGLQWTLFLLGLCINLAGLWKLMQRPVNSEDIQVHLEAELVDISNFDHDEGLEDSDSDEKPFESALTASAAGAVGSVKSGSAVAPKRPVESGLP